MVGKVMFQLLKERGIAVSDIILCASEKSIGKQIDEITILSIQEAIEKKPDFALFSAGNDVSLEWAPKFRDVGTVVIDNSSAWRMDPEIKLVVPEINGSELTENDKIIANPNCSTIQLVMVLAPLHGKYHIKRVVVSTYQSVTGSGRKAIEQLENERSQVEGVRKYAHQIDKNCIPHCDDFIEDGYTKEEIKIIEETKKILNDQSLRITSTAVRVPVVGGHSESVNIEFEKDFEIDEVKQMLQNTKGVEVIDNPDDNQYPMPINAEGKDEVLVGRIRKDHSAEKALNLWIVADNLRKGAATNAVQILDYINKNLKNRN